MDTAVLRQLILNRLAADGRFPGTRIPERLRRTETREQTRSWLGPLANAIERTLVRARALSVGDRLEASASVERDVRESVRPDADRLATSPGDFSSPQPELATVAGVRTSDGSAGPRHVRPSDEIGSGHFEPRAGKVYDRVPHTGVESRHAQRVARVGRCVLLTALVGVACAGRTSARHEFCRDDIEDPLERVVGHERSQRSRARSVGVGKTAAANPHVRLVGGSPEETDGGVLSSPLGQKERGNRFMTYTTCSERQGRWQRVAISSELIESAANKDTVPRESLTPVDVPKCQSCTGLNMVLRSNRSNREFFWGCQKFSICRETRPCLVDGSRLTLEQTPAQPEQRAAKDESSSRIGTSQGAMAAAVDTTETVDLTMLDSDECESLSDEKGGRNLALASSILIAPAPAMSWLKAS